MYVFYPDVFLARNVCMNEIIFFFSFQIMKIPWRKHISELLLAGFVGAVLETALVLLCRNYAVFVVFSQILVVPVILYFLLQKQRNISKKRLVIFIYMVVFLFAGISNGMEQLMGIHFAGQIIFGITIVILEMIVVEIQKVIHLQKYLYKIEIGYRGRVSQCLALYDSGNCLCDPNRHRAVHIADNRIIGELRLETPLMLVPYRALGNEEGVLEVYEADWLKVHINDKQLTFEKILLGKAEESLLKNKQYRMILNEKILENGV